MFVLVVCAYVLPYWRSRVHSCVQKNQHPLSVINRPAAIMRSCEKILRIVVHACILFKPCIFVSRGYHTAGTFETQLQDCNLRLDGQQPGVERSNFVAEACFCCKGSFMSIANQGFLVYKSGTEHKQNNNPDATVF